MQAPEQDLTFSRLLAVAKRRGPIVLVCAIIAVAGSLAYSLSAQKKYTATASLLFNNTPLSQQVAGLQAVVNTNPQGQQDTNIQLLKLGDIAQRTAVQLGHGLTARDVADSLSVSPSGDTTIVELSSTLPSAPLAADVVNTYARIFVDEQSNVNRQYYASALRTVESQIAKLTPREATGAQGLALQNRAQSLATLAQLRTDTVSQAQTAAVPTAASSPSVKRNALVAALLGVVVGILLALVIERLDQYIREPEEFERTYGLPILGTVPQNSSLRRGNNSGPPSSAVTDTFQFVRARLRYFNVDRDLRTLAVVSAQPGDGKTTVAHWLSYAACTMGARVLLIETDLRRPTMAQEVSLSGGRGLADVLIGACAFEEATQAVELDGQGSWPEGARSIDVMVAGALPPNPAEMLESRAMEEVINQANARYDLVVLDTPPLGAVSDALPLMSRVDGVAIVASMRRNRRDAARRLRATLESVDAPMLGVIVNRVKTRNGSRYGYGGYGYESDPNMPRLAPPPGSDGHGFVPADTIRLGAASGNGGAQKDAGLARRVAAHPSVPGSSRSDGKASLRPIGNGAAGDDRAWVGVSAGGHRAGDTQATLSTGRVPAARSKDRIIIYRLGSIGDTVAALPCFHLIEQAFPTAERVVLTNHPDSEKAAPIGTILQPGGFIHRSIPYPLGLRNPRELNQLRRTLREERAHTLIYLAASRGTATAWRDVGFFRICGFNTIIGAPLTDELHENRVDPAGNLERESARLARTLSGLGEIDLSDRGWWDLRLTDEESGIAEHALGSLLDQPFVVVNTGGKAPEKDWGVAAWESLLRRLSEVHQGWGLVFVGGPEDRERAAVLARSWAGPITDLCGRLTPRQSAAAIRRGALFVGHDSGAFHLADAVGTPAVGLFGDYNKPFMWHPSGVTTRVIHRMSGMRDIEPDDVLALTMELTAVMPQR